MLLQVFRRPNAWRDTFEEWGSLNASDVMYKYICLLWTGLPQKYNLLQRLENKVKPNTGISLDNVCKGLRKSADS